jgi:hypothetical protein
MSLSDEQETKLANILETCLEGRKQLNDWERGFLDDQAKRYDEYKSRMSLSPKQWAILDKMYEKVTDVPVTYAREPVVVKSDDDGEIPF